MKLLINYTLNLTPEQRAPFQQEWPELEIVEQRIPDLDTYDGRDIVVLVTEPVPRDLGRWPDLKLVQLLSAGANHLLGHPVFSSSVAVTTASGTHGVPIAQYVTCTWLMMAHRMNEAMQLKASRTWPDRNALAGFSVRGLTAGIIGYGSIGRECARQLQALGLRILCVKRRPEVRVDHDFNAWPGTGDPDGVIPEAWYSPNELAQILPQCDLVVVTAPATPSTLGLIGAREFALMQPDARLIIISRGGIVDETALVDALRSGRLAGAAIDCFVQEPLPRDHPYFDLQNVILTPHISGVHDRFVAAFQSLLLENVTRLKAGRRLLNRASPNAGY